MPNYFVRRGRSRLSCPHCDYVFLQNPDLHTFIRIHNKHAHPEIKSGNYDEWTRVSLDPDGTRKINNDKITNRMKTRITANLRAGQTIEEVPFE